MKNLFFAIMGLILASALVFSSPESINAGYQGGKACSSHWICGPPWYCGFCECGPGDPHCDPNCCWETRCCDSCGQQDPGLWWCMSTSPGGFGTCTFSCGGPTPTPPPGATPPPTPVPTIPPPSSCDITLNPGAATTEIGETTPYTVTFTNLVGSVDRVDFSSSVPAVATVAPASDSTSPYNTVASSLSAGSTTIGADVVMGGVITCSDTATLDVNPVSCDIPAAGIFDVNLLGVGDTAVTLPLTVNESSPIYDVLNVLFTVNPPLVAEVTANPLYPNPDPSFPYRVEIGALAIGSTTYTATATMNDPGATTCSNSANVTVSNPSGWWQVKEGDVMTAGNILSNIPVSCDISPTCDALLITNDPGDDPGVPTFGGTIDPAPGLPLPSVSSTDWYADSSISVSNPTYSFFEARIPSSASVTDLLFPTEPGATFEGVVTGYEWYRHNGPSLTITTPINIPLDKYVILFVAGDLRIDENINLIDGQGLFMVIVSGDIIISGTAGGAAGSGPHLEGIYFAQVTFITEASNLQLHTRGSVSASSVSLGRSLDDNSANPVEIFEYGLDQIFIFPKDLTPQNLIWREVAP